MPSITPSSGLSGSSGSPNGKRTPIHRNQRTQTRKKRRRRGPLIRFRFGMVFFIWLICFASFFAIYMIGQNLFPEDVPTNPSQSSTQDPAETIPQNQTVVSNPAATQASTTTTAVSVVTKINPVPEGAKREQSYLNQCAFLGDSAMHYIGQAGILGTMSVYSSETLNLENYAKEYIMLNQTQIRILSAISGAKCPIYLLFGTDTLGHKSPEATADQFSVLLNAVKAAAPAAEVFVLSIPPVTKEAEAANANLANAAIDQYNSILLTLCQQANVYFIDTNTALKNNESKLDAANASEDGIHLNANGSKKLLDYVLAHVPAA